MEVASTLAEYATTKITDVRSFIVQALAVIITSVKILLHIIPTNFAKMTKKQVIVRWELKYLHHSASTDSVVRGFEFSHSWIRETWRLN
jgi:hypothetical protein